MSADYAPAHWIPAHPNNFDADHNREADGLDIRYVVIHVTQGSYQSAINWFRNPNSQVSAHYIIRSSDGDITQMVADRHVAWHAGNRSYNHQSIGIEHEGWVDNCRWFTDAMYRTSANLVRRLAQQYNIPLNRQHIIGHNEVPGATHTDPGPCWDWEYYMWLVQNPWSTVVDNDTTGRFHADRTVWDLSQWNRQRHGADYRFSHPAPAQQSAFYKFNLPASGYYDLYAWYPSHPGYNGRVRVTVWHVDTDGERQVGLPVYLNQQAGGGRWVHLATAPMLRGDRWRVQVSRWSPGPGYIIADAFKLQVR